MKNKIHFSLFILFLFFSLFGDEISNGVLIDDKWAFSLSYTAIFNDSLLYCSYGGNVIIYDTLLNPIDTLYGDNFIKDIGVFDNGNVIIGRYREGVVVYDNYGNLISEKTDVYVEDIDICNDTLFTVSYGGGIKFYDNYLNEIKDIPMGFVKRMIWRNETLFVADTVNSFVIMNASGDTLYDSGIGCRDISLRADTVYLVETNYFLKFSLNSLSVVDSIPLSGVISVLPLDSALIGISGIYTIYVYKIEDTLLTDTLITHGILQNVCGYNNKFILSLDYNGVEVIEYNDSLVDKGTIDRYNEITGISYSSLYNRIYGSMGTYSGTGNFSFDYNSGEISLNVKQDYGGSSYSNLVYNDSLLIIAGKWYGVFICKITPDSLQYLSRFDTYSAFNIDVYNNYLVVADYNHGVKVLDISDVYSPVLLDSLNTGYYVVDVKFVNDTIIVAGNYGNPSISVIKFDGSSLSKLYDTGSFRIYALDKKDSLLFAGGDSLVMLKWENDTLVEIYSTSTGSFIYDVVHAPWDNEVFLADRYTYRSFVYDTTGFSPRFYYKKYDIWPKSVGFAGYYFLGGSRYCGLFTFIVDIEPPVCDSVLPGETISTNDSIVSMKFYISDDRSGIKDVSVDCDGIFPDSFFYDTLVGYVYSEWINLFEGSHSINLSLSDSCDNAISYNYTVNIDFSPPVVQSLYPLPSTWSGTVDSIGFIEFDDISSVSAVVVLNGDTVNVSVKNDTVFYDIPRYNDTFIVSIHLEDAVGNITDTTYYFMKDVEPVSIEILSPSDICSDSIVLFTAIMSETSSVNSPVDYFSLFIDGDTVRDVVINNDTLYYEGFIGEGIHEYKYLVKDKSGNSTQIVDTFINDYIPPQIVYTYPGDGSYLNTTKVYFRIGFDEDFVRTIKCEIDGNDITDIVVVSDSTIEYINLSPLSNTLHSMYVYIEDTAGFIADTTFSFTVDTILPFISYIYPDVGKIYRKIDTMRLVPSEKLKYLYTIVNKDTLHPFSDEDTVKFLFLGEEGWNEITVYMEDSAQNIYIYVDSIGLDTTPPENIYFVNTDSLVRGGMVKLEWTEGHDNFSGVSFYSLYRNDTLIYMGKSPIYVDYPCEGEHIYKLYSEDNVGNGGWEDSLTIVYRVGVNYVKVYPNPLNLRKTRTLYFEGLGPEMECYLYSEDGRLLYRVCGTVEGKTSLFFDKDYKGILRLIIKDGEGNIKKGVIGVYK